MGLLKASAPPLLWPSSGVRVAPVREDEVEPGNASSSGRSRARLPRARDPLAFSSLHSVTTVQRSWRRNQLDVHRPSQGWPEVVGRR
mmetsp:Transcript_83831/g.187145  ORF Transcript_83831/g.187145 Transcript_83831/m.187145 type:complete len:87 (+) Transcript_83831:267-527(+)